MSSELDAVTRRLAEIDGELRGPHADPSPERYALLKERDELRRQASTFRIDGLTTRRTDELEAELASLIAQAKSMRTSRRGFVAGKGGGNHSPVAGAWVKLIAQARGGADISRIDQRISAIQDELQRRARAG